MLAEWPFGTLNRWFEYYKLEPFGDDWERSTAGPIEIVNAIQSLAHGFGGAKGEAPEPIAIDALVPYRHDGGEKRREALRALRGLEDLRGL